MSGQLRCQPLPAGAWSQNLRRVLSEAAWRQLSREVRRDRTCHGCGVTGRALEAHEAWTVTAGQRALHLRDVVPMCPDCHAVIHIGRTAVTGGLERAAAHLGRVNGWSAAATHAHLTAALHEHAQYPPGVWNVRMDSGTDLHAVFHSTGGIFTAPLSGPPLQLLAHAQRQLPGMPGDVGFVFQDVPLRPLLRTARYAAGDVRASHLLGCAPESEPAAVRADLIVERGGLRGYLTGGARLDLLPCDLTAQVPA